MQYGYFDDAHREYVVQRPDTPAPWVNYLGSPEYGAIISNNAGGYSFAKSGANGRILRYVFNQFDRPGRYLYLRDNASGDFWSASWQPVGKDLQDYACECRHGMGYTRMLSDYAGIHAEAVYYVPKDSAHEVWELSVTNTTDAPWELTLTGYAEFTNHNNYEQDQVNLQYSLFISRTLFAGNRITQQIHGNLDAQPADELVDGKNVTERFFGLAGAEVASYCGDKEAFLGRYHDYGAPQGVASGDLGNVLSYNENACGALSCVVKLAPGESRTVAFLLGMKPSEEAAALVAGYADPAPRCAAEVAALKQDWYGRLNHLQVHTPDDAFNTMINTWNAYNCFITFVWSRAASLIYCGLRNGYGYRDTVQDIQGIIHLEPAMAKEKIRFMLSAQVDNGGGLPAGLYADWNDCLRLGANGESTFVALQFYYALEILRRFAADRGDEAACRHLEETITDTARKIQSLCWDGDRFIRGFTEEGQRIGAAADPEANLWLNPQSWAVISGLADKDQADRAMAQVYDRLNTAYGAVLMDPPYHAHAFEGALAVIYNPGTKENAGIFSQSQGWLILAEALCGHGDRAFTYFTENAPAAQNNRAEVRRLEPYCYGQFTEGPASAHFGRSQVHWLTGTASTVMVGCVEGILGLRPDLNGLRLAPAVPAAWKSFTMDKDFRGKKLHIRVENPQGKESGFASLTLNGEALPDNYLPAHKLLAENDILLVL